MNEPNEPPEDPQDEPPEDPQDESPKDPQDEPPRSEQVTTQHVSARVPENLRSVFSTGVIVMTGNSEFVIDFLQCVGRPRQVAARVVMPHSALPQFIEALKKNLDMYTDRFGSPAELPRPKQERRPTIQEIYDDLKLEDENLTGSYANGVMISHAPAEFSLDFLTNFFPQSAVSRRVFLAAPQVPRMLETLTHTFDQFKDHVRQQREQGGQAPPPGDPPGDPPPPQGPIDAGPGIGPEGPVG